MGIQKQVFKPIFSEKPTVDMMRKKNYSEEEIQQYMYDYRNTELKGVLGCMRDMYECLDADEKIKYMTSCDIPAIVADDYFWRDPSQPWRTMSWEQMTRIPITDSLIIKFTLDEESQKKVYYQGDIAEMFDEILNVCGDGYLFIQMNLQLYHHFSYCLSEKKFSSKKWALNGEKLRHKISQYKHDPQSFISINLAKHKFLEVRPIELTDEQFNDTFKTYCKLFFELLEKFKNNNDTISYFLDMILDATLCLAEHIKADRTYLRVVNEYSYRLHDPILAQKVRAAIS